MKRALAALLVIVGFTGFAMFKGEWTAKVCLLPSTTLESGLTLTYTVAGFDITSTSTFGAAGLTGQAFSFKGALGPFSLSGKMRFDPATPAYEVGQLVTSFDFAGVKLGLTVNHWRDGEWDPVYFGYPAGTADPCSAAITGANLQYVFTTTIAPVSLRVRYLDCSAGTYFQDLLVELKGVEFCCGIKYNASLSFSKEGFSSLTFSGLNIPLCCGVSLDVSVTFGVSSKTVTITPKFAGFAEACFTVWGAPTTTGLINWTGIRIDGYRVRCTLADCNYLEYVHAFDPAATTIPSAIRAKFICGANEYLELGFCGPACCGGKYDVNLRILWSSTTTGTLFGTRAFVGAVKIPIMTNFTLNLDFVMPVAECAGYPSFCFGWTFTF
ncbi:MAG: hypothetical protein NZ924_04090 [Candidatus Bipolaricaulota bacterium]|nr:hypothetical protein [Candidatus Bipolaricaulota bacterium]MDW8152082.1 hypothetical protein [Candidatus Bipolaricaulota bacterium]